MAAGGTYVFSVDLEDVRLHRPADPAASRVPAMTERFLQFLAARRATATFFVVGELARAQPDLVRRIVAAGHEIGCHSDTHIPLTQQTATSFREDLLRNLDALDAAGVGGVRGYRAPCFSLTEATRWAYPVLADAGFTYSSSVLPARNPIHGWEGFGPEPRLVDSVLELPVTLLPHRILRVPMGGGVYFRVLPSMLLRDGFRRRAGEAVLGYFHPYDIDTDHRAASADFPERSPYQWLLRRNRGAVFDRLEAIGRLGFSFNSYAQHEKTVRHGLAMMEACR